MSADDNVATLRRLIAALCCLSECDDFGAILPPRGYTWVREQY